MSKESIGGYTADWEKVSHDIKTKRGWRCEICKYQRQGSSFIQVHHIDGDKTDNCTANLQVLCAICHGAKHGNNPLWPYSASEVEMNAVKKHHAEYVRNSK